MKYILLAFAFIACNTFAKTTYIPVYRTFIQIKAQNDSITESSKLMTAELISQDNTIRIYVQHENVTKEKVKAIKRAKMAAGFAEFAANTSSVSTTLSTGSPNFHYRLANSEYSYLLASMYQKNAIAEQKLDVFAWIDNISEQEIVLNDLERETTWYILPKHSMRIKLGNPEVMNLRISNVDPKNLSVKYVKVGVGSIAGKNGDWV